MEVAYSRLKAIARSHDSEPAHAFVLPAFDLTQSVPSKQPAWVTDRSQLAQMLHEGLLVPFGSAGGLREEWLPGHKCTHVERWLNATSVYRVKHCDPYYEPYLMLARKDVPSFDESFAGRGFDKASFVYELFARGFQFWVLPDVFVVHQQESRSHTPGPNCPEAAPGVENELAQNNAADIARRRNPGETCIRSFIERMQDTYGYAPRTAAHAQFSVVARDRGWECATRREPPRPRPRLWSVRPVQRRKTSHHQTRTD